MKRERVYGIKIYSFYIIYTHTTLKMNKFIQLFPPDFPNEKFFFLSLRQQKKF